MVVFSAQSLHSAARIFYLGLAIGARSDRWRRRPTWALMCREYVHNWHISMLILWPVLLAAASYWALHGRWLPSHYYSRVSWVLRLLSVSFISNSPRIFLLFEPRFYAYVCQPKMETPSCSRRNKYPHMTIFGKGQLLDSIHREFVCNQTNDIYFTFLDILLVRNFCHIRIRVIFRIFLFIFFFFYFPASPMNSIKVKIVDKTTERVNKVKK
jgi:hypothetical protein